MDNALHRTLKALAALVLFAPALAGAVKPDCSPVKIAPNGSLPTATAGSAYATTLSATEGVATITNANYSVTRGTLPANVVLSAAGAFSGTPAASGNTPFRVTVVNVDSGCSGSREYVLHVNVAVPTVTAVSPASGPTAGGTSVAITGTGFTGATAVTFGATAATSFTVNTATSITATAPAGSAGTVDVRVTTAGGTSAVTAADQYTYATVPTVTSISPTSGPTAGGTSVAITGTGFTGATAVTFGATAATSFTVNTATSITATAPAGTGTLDVRVTTAGGISATSAADQYTYIAAPTVTSISPTSGPTAGGTSVAITGTGFTGATAVTFGATAATSFTVNTATSITATAPAGTGTVDVRVTTAGGTSATSAADQYTYIAAPTVTSISPTSGPNAGGTSVAITGTGFTGATAVTFGATAATSFTVNTATSITATAPAGTGTVDVRVTTAGGTSATSAADQFSYLAPPTANNDSYATVGNTALAVGVAVATPRVDAATLLLANDTGSAPFTITITQNPAGTISSLNTATGAFVYTPPLGFTGTDTFKYTITDSAAQVSAAATVSIAVNGRVLYVNGAAVTNGSGASATPFNTLAGVVPASGDTVFVQSGGSPTTTPGAIPLPAGVTLWGQGTSLPQISGITIAGTAATSKPKLTGTVTLGGSNTTVSALDITTTGAVGLTNTGSPTGVTVSNAVTVSATGAPAVSLANASGTFAFRSISASGVGVGSGLSLNAIGGAGFTVSGDGATAGSGGSISGACSTAVAGCGAVKLDRAGTVSLSFMTLSGANSSGVYATDTALAVASTTVSNFPVVGIRLGVATVASGTFNLQNNTLTGSGGDAIQLQLNGTGTWTGHVKGNIIGNAATANSGSLSGNGIGIDVAAGAGVATVDVSNNQVRQINASNGIRATATTGTLNASVLNNTITMAQTTSLDGVTVGSSSTVCLNATGNAAAAAGTAAANGQYDGVGMSVLQNTATSVFRIQGYAGPATNDAQVQSYLAAGNTLSGPGGPSFADQTSAANTNGFGVAACATAP